MGSGCQQKFPNRFVRTLSRRFRTNPDAVQNDLEAQGKAAPAEKKEKPPVGETVGFRMARQFAETEPGFKDFIVALANKLQNG